ncbi:NUDIX domain-containing protein [Acidaminobacter sp. JC074]|uniref:NUDIX domain-containing protein n=1 Tax=Acidaminobacter sp. JC074 TaxID=2530199 RepID=UPI001F0D974A|nr:NUDIX domain-containing protein [Acidaminobacter sp. JC074]MCH4887858.1 NUDIX domain-containing protein [Acidaminobacter sp. JC074]
MQIRNAVKAVIIEEDKVLLIKHQGNYYTFPGGGQDHNESIHEALKRECLEEIGAQVEVNELIYITEYMADRHEGSIHQAGFHQVDLFFRCKRVSGFNNPVEIDDTQVGFEWVDLDQLEAIALYPLAIRDRLMEVDDDKRFYLGVVR